MDPLRIKIGTLVGLLVGGFILMVFVASPQNDTKPITEETMVVDGEQDMLEFAKGEIVNISNIKYPLHIILGELHGETVYVLKKLIEHKSETILFTAYARKASVTIITSQVKITDIPFQDIDLQKGEMYDPLTNSVLRIISVKNVKKE